jgi:SulP family sulfate permease
VADRLKNVLSQIERPPKVFILRMRHVPFMDATGANALEEFYTRCRRQNTRLILSGVQVQPREVLIDNGLVEKFGRDNVTDHIDKALARAQQLLS